MHLNAFKCVNREKIARAIRIFLLTRIRQNFDDFATDDCISANAYFNITLRNHYLGISKCPRETRDVITENRLDNVNLTAALITALCNENEHKASPIRRAHRRIALWASLNQICRYQGFILRIVKLHAGYMNISMSLLGRIGANFMLDLSTMRVS